MGVKMKKYRAVLTESKHYKYRTDEVVAECYIEAHGKAEARYRAIDKFGSKYKRYISGYPMYSMTITEVE